MDTKSRLKEIEEKVEYAAKWEIGEILAVIKSKDYSWLVEQVELADQFGRKMAELNQFLNKYADEKGWGKNVVDIAMQVMDEQSEQIEGLRAKIEKMEQQNKRYRYTIAEFKENTNKVLQTLPVNTHGLIELMYLRELSTHVLKNEKKY